MHNTGTIFTVGPHAFKLADRNGNLIRVGQDVEVHVWFDAWHANGWKEKPSTNKPNALGWQRSRWSFVNTPDGVQAAVAYARYLLRESGMFSWSMLATFAHEHRDTEYEESNGTTQTQT